MTLNRRDWLRAASIAGASLLVSRRAMAETLFASPLDITVYKTPTCGCCKAWVTHLEKNGFTVKVHDLTDVSEIKKSMGVPSALESCHTGVIGRYVIEGHVPADLIKKLVEEDSKEIAGIAVPGMPAGSPGMETGRKDPYDVIAFTKEGKRSVYAKR